MKKTKTEYSVSELARKILIDNDYGGYTVPTKKLYPFQWKWDSCFCALGWHTFDKLRAWKELETLFVRQWKTGQISHITFHEDHDTYFPGEEVWRAPHGIPTSGITQPPVMAVVVRKLYDYEGKSPEVLKKIRELVPCIFSCHRWFHTQRDPQETGLVAIYHPWESGRDNSAEWDRGLSRVSTQGLLPYERRDLNHVEKKERPTKEEYDRFVALIYEMRESDYDSPQLYKTISFKQADVGINAILLRANKDLLYLMEELKSSEEDKNIVKNWIDIQKKGIQRLWNPESSTFQSLDLISGELSGLVTSASFLPLFTGALSDEQAYGLTAKLHRWADEIKFMVPSHDPEDIRFDPARYWRGPVWAVMNYMIAEGLRIYDHDELAERVQRDTLKLISESGFYEYFNPVTGQGCGGNYFSWTAAIWLAWCDHKLQSL